MKWFSEPNLEIFDPRVLLLEPLVGVGLCLIVFAPVFLVLGDATRVLNVSVAGKVLKILISKKVT